MKCINCETEMSPSFVKAIEDNYCPACGKNLYDDTVKELITGLKEALETMGHNPIGLAGWLLSNFHMKKIGDCAPVEFYGTKKAPDSSTPLKIADNPLQKFLKNAGVESIADIDKQSHYKSLAAQINSGEDILIEEEFLEEEDPTYTMAALKAMGVNGGEADPNLKKLLKQQVDKDENIQGEESPILQIQRLKKLKAQASIQSGGSGSFRRGS
jgi:hypothetical protein